MDNSVGTTIEKIKILEQDKEAVLKEKREYEASVALLQRNVRDIINQLEKSKEEQKMLADKNIKLNTLLQIEEIKNKALIEQSEVLKNELQKLKNKINDDISNVWNMRASFCETIQKTSDEYNIWALLMKPVKNYTEHSKPKNMQNIKDADSELLSNNNTLQSAIDRRNIAREKRNFLLTEPEKGEEFLRIKNALRYSLEKISSLKN